MNKLFFAAIAALSIGTSTAQVKEGTVVYERKINMYKRITDEQMRAYMPEFRTSKHMLLFSDSTSIYKTVPEDEMPEPSEGGNAPRVMFRMGGGDADELYKNFAVSKSVTQTDLGAKTYIIEDSIRQQRWKLTDETKKIAGYNCRKAVTTQKQRMGGSIIRMTTTEGGSTKTDSSKTKMEPKTVDVDVVAWYAEDLVSPVGPENNGSLPGVILQLDINKGETVFTAIEVKSTVNKKELKEPSKGKKVTREAFTKMQMEMMNNMQSGGGRTIRFGN